LLTTLEVSRSRQRRVPVLHQQAAADTLVVRAGVAPSNSRLPSTRTFFCGQALAAASLTAGATITSTNWRSTMAAAVCRRARRLKAMMPPKADSGSVAKARS
jgi:hypothetical protein